MIKVGRNPDKTATAIMAPDCVVKVICHAMASCTSADPKSEIAWVERKMATGGANLGGPVRPAWT